ncbi:MAG: imidazole glycerol phosphate synthase subunit HisF [Phycisphaerales bacterium]|nr:imidazole glycerol phosphate synthase subunit HisF [Phycisphaerales bacterium]
MLTSRVIPCLDCRDGRVVKGVQFQGLRDAGDPVELAARYEAEGADELVILDVSATPQGRANQTDTIKRVRKVLSIPLTVGGGVRTSDDAKRLLDAGADKVGVNTAAVLDPALLTKLAERFGRQCIVIAIDAARTEPPETNPTRKRGATAAIVSSQPTSWHVVIRSGEDRRPLDAIEWARNSTHLGAGEILLTSWDRDGTKAGYDFDLLRAVSSAVTVPVIASGGAAGPQHLIEALQAGADAVLAASIFHDGHYTVRQVKEALAKAGFRVRDDTVTF